MTLEQYLTINGISQEAFGKRVGLTQTMVSYMLTGKRSVSPHVALEILRASNGQIDAESLPMSKRGRETLRSILASDDTTDSAA